MKYSREPTMVYPSSVSLPALLTYGRNTTACFGAPKTTMAPELPFCWGQKCLASKRTCLYSHQHTVVELTTAVKIHTKNRDKHTYRRSRRRCPSRNGRRCRPTANWLNTHRGRCHGIRRSSYRECGWNGRLLRRESWSNDGGRSCTGWIC